MSDRVAISHRNTFYVRKELAALGGVWSPYRKAWLVPAGQAKVAQSLVENFETGEDLQDDDWGGEWWLDD
jgi:hypothetical protein